MDPEPLSDKTLVELDDLAHCSTTEDVQIRASTLARLVYDLHAERVRADDAESNEMIARERLERRPKPRPRHSLEAPQIPIYHDRAFERSFEAALKADLRAKAPITHLAALLLNTLYKASERGEPRDPQTTLVVTEKDLERARKALSTRVDTEAKDQMDAAKKAWMDAAMKDDKYRLQALAEWAHDWAPKIFDMEW